MDLKDIMAIGGKPGLFKMVAQAKNGIIVESLIDKKRNQAFTTDKISTLEEISIFTESEDKPLKEIFKSIFEKLEGKAAPDFKNDSSGLKKFFGEVLPEYDKERVYVSHMQKVVAWYNLLQKNELLDFTETPETEDSGDKPGTAE